jgi:tetratricopeptide (TPR) repeat protein
MPEDVFERYKEALKDGHVAVLRGRLEEAIAHYRRAGEIATERALPHSSIGGVLVRLGRVDEALAAYEEALRRAPLDEAALSGQSDALLAAGRRAEAAEVLDRLAQVQLDKGHRADAHATRDLARAIRHAGGHARAGEHGGTGTAAEGPAGPAETQVLAEPGGAEALESESAELPGDEPLDVGDDPGALVRKGEERLAAGRAAAARKRPTEAVRAYVAAARAYAAAGAIDGALDACQQALTVAPGAAEVHLALARLYFRRGWRDRAVEKLLLLDRLLDLEGAEAPRASLASLANEHLPDEPRLASVARAQRPLGEPRSGPGD